MSCMVFNDPLLFKVFYLSCSICMDNSILNSLCQPGFQRGPCNKSNHYALSNAQAFQWWWVIIACDATSGWQTSTTRCDVCVVDPMDMRGISQSSSWSTWWVMDGSDNLLNIHLMQHDIFHDFSKVPQHHQYPHVLSILPGLI